MVGHNPLDSSVLFETFFQVLQRHPFFKVISIAKQKFNLQGKKSLKTNLNPLITDLKYSVPSGFQCCVTSKKNFCDDSSNSRLMYRV